MNDEPIRAAVAAHVHQLGGYDAATELLGSIEKSQLHRYAEKGGTARIPLALAIDLDAIAGNAALIRLAAARLGYRLVPFDAATSVDSALDAVCDLVAKAGALAPSVREKAADRVFSPNERRDLHREIAAVQASLAALTTSIGGES